MLDVREGALFWLLVNLQQTLLHTARCRPPPIGVEMGRSGCDIHTYSINVARKRVGNRTPQLLRFSIEPKPLPVRLFFLRKKNPQLGSALAISYPALLMTRADIHV